MPGEKGPYHWSQRKSKGWLENLVTKEKVSFEFNPTEYSLTKAVNYSSKDAKGANTPTLSFGGGQPAQLTLKLFFDTSDTGEDVRKAYTDKLWKLALVHKDKKDAKTQKGEPPHCRFHWGSGTWFEAVVTNITQTFVMFLEDGTPTRSNVDLTLKQVKDDAVFNRQNPTSGGVAGYRTHVLREGETLDKIAAEEYGDAKHWRYIASENRLENPRRLRPGSVLRLPPLPE